MTSLSHVLAIARLLFEISTPECSGVSGRDSTLVFEPNFLTAILMCVARLLDLLYSPPPSPCCSCRRPALPPAAARATDKPPAVTRFSPGIPKSARRKSFATAVADAADSKAPANTGLARRYNGGEWRPL
jgi:hypothetical protein